MITQNNNSLCSESKLYYYDSLCEESSEQIPEHISRHIEKCENCRREIEKLKAVLSKKQCDESGQKQNTSAVTKMLELHFAYIDKRVTCETVRPFLPGLLDPSIEITIPTPITVHLDNCPQCAEDLKEIQRLSKLGTQLYQLTRILAEGSPRENVDLSEMAQSVKAMAQRANSDVITIYHVDQSAKEKKVGQANDLYSGFPINVEIINQKVDDEQPVPAIDFAAALKEKVKAINLKSLLKIGIAAAAVIVVGFALFLNTTSAEADVGGKIYGAIKDVQNIYISTIHTGDKPTQERWISQTLKVYISKTAKESVLFDIKNSQVKRKNSDTAVVNTSKMTEDEKAVVRQGLFDSLGLVPLNDISNLPPDSKWNQRDDLQAPEGIEIYDLERIDPTNQSSVLNKWRFYVDSKTFLPQKIEVYRTPIGGGEYNRINLFIIRKISESDILAVKQAF